jgi:hypothetical protein
MIEFDNTKVAETVLNSVSVDDFDFVKSKKTDKKLEAHIESNSISSLLHTLDDYLACISVAEKVVKK